MQQRVLDFYADPAPMSSSGGYAPLFDALPRGVPALVRVVQGLALHEYMAPAYGVAIPEERRGESHVRPVERLLERVLAQDSRPLAVARPVGKRLVGVCRHFALLMVSFLRAQAVPARVRCGFGSYFRSGSFEEHLVCETWNAAEARWVLVDPQFDEVWQRELKIDHDVLDVPRDRFLIAGDAWARCRADQADPARFGIHDLRGPWIIAAELVRDVAALNKMEMLPWDQWGAMPGPGEALAEDRLAFFDELAALTRAPDRATKVTAACACRRPSSTRC